MLSSENTKITVFITFRLSSKQFDTEQQGALFLLLLLPDMRKALSRDAEKKSIIPLPHPVRPEDIE